MIVCIKIISFGVLVVVLIIMIMLMVVDVEFYGFFSVYVFMVLWSLYKIFLWFIGDEFGIVV